jgi:hypothetical protein
MSTTTTTVPTTMKGMGNDGGDIPPPTTSTSTSTAPGTPNREPTTTTREDGMRSSGRVSKNASLDDDPTGMMMLDQDALMMMTTMMRDTDDSVTPTTSGSGGTLDVSDAFLDDLPLPGLDELDANALCGGLDETLLGNLFGDVEANHHHQHQQHRARGDDNGVVDVGCWDFVEDSADQRSGESAGSGGEMDDAARRVNDVGASSKRKTATPNNGKETDEERKLRLMRNRESAQNSRARKREYLRDLEKRARALEVQNGELQALVMHLTNENHALRISLQQTTGGAQQAAMMYPVYPIPTPKLPLPPMGAETMEAPPSPEQELKKPEPKRRKKTMAASVTALALGTLSVVGLVSPGATPASTQSSASRKLLALGSAMGEQDDLSRAMMSLNITSLREEISRREDERMFALPERATVDGGGLTPWGDKTLDGRVVDVMQSQDVNDPWYSAFREAGMTQHINLLSRVMCKEVFKFKAAADEAGAAQMTKVWEQESEKVTPQRVGPAIPMLSGKENASSIPETGDIDAHDSLVSVLLPPPNPTAGVVQQLSKLFVVTYNKRTMDYTTHSCLMPQPSAAHHV